MTSYLYSPKLQPNKAGGGELKSHDPIITWHVAPNSITYQHHYIVWYPTTARYSKGRHQRKLAPLWRSNEPPCTIPKEALVTSTLALEEEPIKLMLR